MTDATDDTTRRQFMARCAAAPLAASLANLPLAAESAVAAEPAKSLLRRAPRLTEAELAAEVERLMLLVDPELIYRYQPIAPETNAWPVWQQAAELLVELPDDEEFADIYDKTNGRSHEITAQQWQRIAEWVEKNEPCRKLVDEGIARGAFEHPRSTRCVRLPLEQEITEKCRKLSRFLSASCGVAIHRSQFHAAAGCAVSGMKMGRILSRAECLLVDYLVGMAIYSFGAQAACQVGVTPGVPIELAKSLIAELDATRPTEEDRSRAVRAEFNRWFLPSVADLPDVGAASTLVSYLESGYWSPDFVPSAQQIAELEHCFRQINTVFADHPSLFDKLATAQLGSRLVQQNVSQLNEPYLQRDWSVYRAVQDEMANWPKNCEIGSLALIEVPSASSGLPELTGEELDKARASLRPIENVIGKHMLSESFSFIDAPIAERHRCSCDAIRLRIALLLFERQHGRLPERLDDLVAAGLLPSVPADPYDVAPFRYSAERRVIWVVDENGENNGQLPEPDDSGEPIDRPFGPTWPIP